GLGRPNSSQMNSADSRLSWAATMVGVNSIGIVLTSLLGCGQLQGDVVRIAKLQNVGRPDVFDRLVGDPALVELRCGGVYFGFIGAPERDVVQAGAIFVEA